MNLLQITKLTVFFVLLFVIKFQGQERKVSRKNRNTFSQFSIFLIDIKLLNLSLKALV